MFSHRSDVISRFYASCGNSRCPRIGQRWTKAADITWVSPISSKDPSTVFAVNVNASPVVCYLQLPSQSNHGPPMGPGTSRSGGCELLVGPCDRDDPQVLSAVERNTRGRKTSKLCENSICRTDTELCEARDPNSRQCAATKSRSLSIFND